jgi:hypothetical protein
MLEFTAVAEQLMGFQRGLVYVEVVKTHKQKHSLLLLVTPWLQLVAVLNICNSLRAFIFAEKKQTFINAY